VQDKNCVLLLCLHIFVSNFLPSKIGFWFHPCYFFWKFFLLLNYFILQFFLFGENLTFFYFLFVGECEFLSDDSNKYTLRIWMIRTSLGLFLALVEFEGQLFSYLENLTRLNCIREGMRKGKKDGGDQCHF
jgi:hypothetical protein